jgi:hypothetical protein
MPKKMRIAVINYVVYWLTFITKEGQDLSPREMIMGGQKIDYQKMCRLPFRSYVQVHNDNVTNTMETRTSGEINWGQQETYKEVIVS